MNIPRLTGIVDLTALQNAVALVLLSDDRLRCPVVTELKLHAESELHIDALWTLPRGAFAVTASGVEALADVTDQAQEPTGAGLLVEMPRALVKSPGVTGPPLVWQVPVVCFEERNANLSPGGNLVTAEQFAQFVFDILHLQSIFGLGTLQALDLGPAQDWLDQVGPGVYAWRATLQAVAGRTQTPRSAVSVATFAGGQCAIACADPQATVLYTLDGSAPVKANPSAVQYLGQFPVQSGQLVLTATWRQGQFINSEITGWTAP
jgi:hypothetical protein